MPLFAVPIVTTLVVGPFATEVDYDLVLVWLNAPTEAVRNSRDITQVVGDRAARTITVTATDRTSDIDTDIPILHAGAE